MERERKWNAPHLGLAGKNLPLMSPHVLSLCCQCDPTSTMTLGARGWKEQSHRMQSAWFPKSPLEWEKSPNQAPILDAQRINSYCFDSLHYVGSIEAASVISTNT